MEQVTGLKESWCGAVALVGRRRGLVREQLGLRSVYRLGVRLLSKLVVDVDPLLPPTGAALSTLQQLRSCGDCQVSTDDSLYPFYNLQNKKVK